MANYIVSDNDLETRKCYICLTDTEPIIYACQCKGTNYGVHKECLERWILIGEAERCSICKYKYKYNLSYNPSCDRLKKSFTDCERKEITNNDNLFIFIVFYIVISSVLIFFISLFLLNYNVSYLPVYYLLFQILSILLFKKLDRELLYLTALKLWSFTAATFIYGYIFLLFATNNADCINNCVDNKYVCSNNCTYYDNYIDHQNNIQTSLTSQIVVNICVVLFDFCNRIYKSLFEKSIKPYRIKKYRNRVTFIE